MDQSQTVGCERMTWTQTSWSKNSSWNTSTLSQQTNQMQPSSSWRNDQMENTGDHERDGNTLYDQGNTCNSDNPQKHGTMNTNYHNMQSSLTNTGTSTGTMKTWNETAERKLNSSRDACLKKGVMSWFIYFFPFTYLIVTPDHLDHLSTPPLGIPMLSLRNCVLRGSDSHEQLILRLSLLVFK